MVAHLPRLLMLFVLLSAGSALGSDVAENLSLIVDNNENDSRAEVQEGSPAKHVNELSLLCAFVIRLYQKTVSSQDVPACNFTHSCSRFGFDSIQRHGPLHGIMMTADRLQRCNAFSRRYYPVDPMSGLAIDHPVDWYRLH